MKFYAIERIKKILGLPQDATTGQIEAKIAELMVKEGELEALKGQRGAREEKEPQASSTWCKLWGWWK